MSILDDLHLIDDPHERELRTAIVLATSTAYVLDGEPVGVDLTDGSRVIGYGSQQPGGVLRFDYTIIPAGMETTS